MGSRISVFLCVEVEVESADDADTSELLMAQVSTLSWTQGEPIIPEL